MQRVTYSRPSRRRERTIDINLLPQKNLPAAGKHGPTLQKYVDFYKEMRKWDMAGNMAHELGLIYERLPEPRWRDAASWHAADVGCQEKYLDHVSASLSAKKDVVAGLCNQCFAHRRLSECHLALGEHAKAAEELALMHELAAAHADLDARILACQQNACLLLGKAYAASADADADDEADEADEAGEGLEDWCRSIHSSRRREARLQHAVHWFGLSIGLAARLPLSFTTHGGEAESSDRLRTEAYIECGNAQADLEEWACALGCFHAAVLVGSRGGSKGGGRAGLSCQLRAISAFGLLRCLIATRLLACGEGRVRMVAPEPGALSHEVELESVRDHAALKVSRRLLLMTAGTFLIGALLGAGGGSVVQGGREGEQGLLLGGYPPGVRRDRDLHRLSARLTYDGGHSSINSFQPYAEIAISIVSRRG